LADFINTIDPVAATAMRIQSALEQAGIVFLDRDASGGIGVRLKK
jgi:hypothetical protein